MIEIKEDVKIGNIILEKGDKIKVLESTRGILGVYNNDGTVDWMYNHYDSSDLEQKIIMIRNDLRKDPEAILDLADENERSVKDQIQGRDTPFADLDLFNYSFIYDKNKDVVEKYKNGRKVFEF